MTRATEIANSAITESACEWLITLQESPVSSSDRRHFADWLLESPIHVREYLAVEVTWRLLADALSCTDFDLATCNDAATPSVVPLRRISH